MKRQPQFGRVLKAVMIVLLAVFALSATAYATHIHADASQDGHCQLCLMAHHSVVPALQVAPVTTRTVVGVVYIANAEPAVSRSVLTTRIRPPPVSL